MKKALIVFVLFATLVSLFAVNASAVASSDDSSELQSAGTSSEDSSVASAETDGAISLKFSTQRVPTVLRHFVIGIVGVIIVLALIALVVFILNHIIKP